MRAKPYLYALLPAVALFTAACPGIDPSGVEFNLTDEPVETPEPSGLVINSEEGCIIDDDCAAGTFCFQNTCARVCDTDGDCPGGTCSPRGRCGDDDVVDAMTNLRIVSFPDTVRIVSATEETVSFEFGLSANMPVEGIPFRVRRNDGYGDSTRIHYATGTDTFTITVETGLARPSSDHETRPVTLTIFSPIGNIDLLLNPRPAYEGVWVGDLKIDSFGGSQGFDLRAWVTGTDVDDLSLALPVSNSTLFSPRDAHDPERDYEIVPLVFRSNTNTYQALFTYEYRFQDGLFGDHRPRQVERTLRFDFDAPALRAGRLEGRFADSWRGLHNTQRTSGEREVGTVDFIGGFTFERIGDLDRPRSSFTAATPQPAQPALNERGTLSSCLDSYFALENFDVEDETYHCDGITSAVQFLAADAETQASCALAMSTSVSMGETTANQIALYFAEEPGPQGLSFEDFLKACADDANTVCMPSERSICAFELAAAAAQHIHRDNIETNARVSALLADLMIALADMSSEAFLARQLGAFYNDMELRRQWLRSSAAPAVFLAAVETANENLMLEWKDQVLDVHHDVFMSFFTQDAITFLARAVEGELPNERRRELLAEAGVLWRGYSEALQLAASRWNESVRDTVKRDAYVEFLQGRALELYLTLGLLNDFNRAAGASFQSAGLASNFASLSRSIERLGTSFQDAIFARDAEVVTARSLNPLSDNNSLLSERRGFAQSTVATARAAIEQILDDVTIEAIAEADFRARMADSRNQAANRIAELCGLPTGCTETDLYTRPECLVIAPGECGLANPGNPEIGASFDPSRVAASEAGRAILNILEAYQNLAIQNDEFDTHLAKLDLQLAELEAFRGDVERWNELRLEGVQQLETNLAMRDQIRDERIRTMLDTFATYAQTRQEGIASMRQSIADSHRANIAGANASYRQTLIDIGIKRATQLAVFAANMTAAGFSAAAEALPKTVGTSNDVSAPARANLQLAASIATLTGQGISLAAELAWEQVEAARERDAALKAAESARLQELAALDSAITDAQMAELEEALRVSTQVSDDDIARLVEIIELMREQRAAELAYARDMAEYREKRTAFMQKLQETSGHDLRVERTKFNILQRTLEYEAIIQKARLEASRMAELDRRVSDLDSLVGGLGAIFSQTYALERAETYLNRSREALMDWLVVLEYYAVRPFIAERIQIHLARNAYQLEAIANRLLELEASCGGSERSKATATLSLRRDVLAVDRPQQSPVDEEHLMSADERFLQWLQQSYVGVDRRIRFSTSETLTHVLDGNADVLAASFNLSLAHFANLDLACNAKIESIAINLVGDLGTQAPTATLLYDGTSQLRSCQPNIEEYVRAFGAGLTSYGTITNLRTEGRAMSPLTGVNGFPASDTAVNRTLAGLPVASEYTLLISTERGDNARLDWSKLEDVEIRVEYSYQDLFPTACD